MPNIQETITLLSKLPGLGPKSASRILFHLLKMNKDYVTKLTSSLNELRSEIKLCSQCYNYTFNSEKCEICSDLSRHQDIICVVENVSVLLSLEQLNVYKGLYFVLHGHLNPLEGLGPNEIRVPRLEKWVQENSIKEIILATNPTLEGDATAYYIGQLLNSYAKVTRLASGLPFGGDLEYLDKLTISKALEGRLNLI